MTAAAPTHKHPRLQIDDTLGRRVVIIDKPVFRIGRKSESDLRPVSVDVSREHAELRRGSTGDWQVVDLGSTNGIKVNDPRTDLPKLRARVGMVFQHFELFPHLRIIENLCLAQEKVLGRSHQAALADSHGGSTSRR